MITVVVFFKSAVSLVVCFVMQCFDLIFAENKGFLGEQRVCCKLKQQE